jgi:hypothetical protein
LRLLSRARIYRLHDWPGALPLYATTDIKMSKNKKFGATGEFPQGKLNGHDEGQLQFGVTTTSNGKVVLNFGHEVAWLAFDPTQAVKLASILISNARKAAQITGEVLTVEIG